MNPWSNFQNFMQTFRQMASNPAQYAMKNMGVSQDMANDPDAIIQKMMQDGKITQAQYNQARSMAMQIQNNPMFKQLMK